MLNFRKLKQEFSHRNVSKQGITKENHSVKNIDIIDYNNRYMRVEAYLDNIANSINDQSKTGPSHITEIEINLLDSSLSDSKCSKCNVNTDCIHVVSAILELEHNFDVLLGKYLKKITNVTPKVKNQEEQKDIIDHKLESQNGASRVEAVTQTNGKPMDISHSVYDCINTTIRMFSDKNQTRKMQALLQEYGKAYELFATSAFFRQNQLNNHRPLMRLIIICTFPKKNGLVILIKLALKIGNSKPRMVHNIEEFFIASRTQVPFSIFGHSYILALSSFVDESQPILKILKSHLQLVKRSTTDSHKIGLLDKTIFGDILNYKVSYNMQACTSVKEPSDGAFTKVPGVFVDNLYTQLQYCADMVNIEFEIKRTKGTLSCIMLTPKIMTQHDSIIIEKSLFIESETPLLVYDNVIYRFQPNVSSSHISSIFAIKNTTIPEALFGTLVKQAIPILTSYATITKQCELTNVPTVVSTEEIIPKVYLKSNANTLECKIFFLYNGQYIPGVCSQMNGSAIQSFYMKNGMLVRDVFFEQRIIKDLFLDFKLDVDQGVFYTQDEKTMIDFMSQIVPNYSTNVIFEHDYTLQRIFSYDDTKVDIYIDVQDDDPSAILVNIIVSGPLKGAKISFFAESVAQNKLYIELQQQEGCITSGHTLSMNYNKDDSPLITNPHFLIFSKKFAIELVALYNIIGMSRLEESYIIFPSWKLPIICHWMNTVENNTVENNIRIELSKKASAVLNTIYSTKDDTGEEWSQLVPSNVNVLKTKLRHYQHVGVLWLKALRELNLNGILADDMGLGKTIQVISCLLQQKFSASNNSSYRSPSIVICPTSLLYNWLIECQKYTDHLSVAIIKGGAHKRCKDIERAIHEKTDLLITSYALVQKDIKHYIPYTFNYLILDEAQYIKNSKTINAQVVRMLNASCKLALTGTPIENSLSDLWSIIDFLMPNILGSKDLLMHKYSLENYSTESLNQLGKTLSPFILRRMKEDVLDELPPRYEIRLYCQLSKDQAKLYKEIFAVARQECYNMVQHSGFEKSKIHILGILTRLKQTCCHPGIFSPAYIHKENASDKYELLKTLLLNLNSLGHKTVVFSQYTQMLNIIKEDLLLTNGKFCYLDGSMSTEDRNDVIYKFNTDSSIPVLLASIKAGGIGINLTGADTVIHYDLSWNPAVEAQASDRIHRIGQDKKVFVYKLITKDTLEDKIIEIQDSKKHIMHAMGTHQNPGFDITWDNIVKLLQTD